MNTLVILGIIGIVAGLLIPIEAAMMAAIVAAILIAGRAIAPRGDAGTANDAGRHGMRWT
jgi:hypothetical protein